MKPMSRREAHKVTVWEERHVIVQLHAAIGCTLQAHSDLIRGLTSHYTVAPQRPVGTILADVCSTAAFIFAVIPFFEIISNLGLARVASQATCFQRALHRTDEHEREFASM